VEKASFGESRFDMSFAPWREAVLQGRLQRQLLLRGEAYRVLMVMSRALQGWRGWLADKRLRRLKHSR
jgi:hypothetical protein